MIDQYINRHGKRLYGLCLRLCADAAEAEELYQETWLRVLKSMDRYDESRPFEPWLTRICVNIYRNTLRRLTRSPIWNGFATAADKDRVFEAVPTPEARDYSELHAAIDRLPDKLRTTVILFYFRGLSIDGTAEVLGIPPGTVKSRLSKARARLKEVLSDEPGF